MAVAACREAVTGGADRGASPPGAPPSSARALLDSLRRIESDLAAERRFVRLAEDEIGAASREAASPASSPEEAEHTARFSRQLRGTLDSDLERARERTAVLEGRRRDVLADMARSGFFEDRWVADGVGAVYLRVNPDADGAARHELLGAPWPIVKDAPPGDHPEETIRRGEILAAADRRARGILVLAGAVAAAACLSDLLLPDAWLGVVVLVAAVAGSTAFPASVCYLVEWLFFRESALARSAEEAAARAHLDLVGRGVADRPPLETLVRESREGVVERYRRGQKRPALPARLLGPTGPGAALHGAGPEAGDPKTDGVEGAPPRGPDGPDGRRATDGDESSDQRDEGRSG